MSNLGNKETIAKNIRRYMESRGVTSRQVCDELGFKYNSFSDWINAKYYPRIDKIEMLANYFGCEKSDLIEEPKPYYTSDYAADLAQFAKDNPQYQVLFDASRNVKPEDIEKVMQMITIMTGSDKND